MSGPIPALSERPCQATRRPPPATVLVVVAPGRQPAAAAAVADELGFQPARQPVFARGRAEAVGGQHQARDRPAALGRAGGVLRDGREAAGAIEQSDEGVQLGAELILAAQADDDALALRP